MRQLRQISLDALAVAIMLIFFVVPFAFILLTAVKDRAGAADLDLSWPENWRIADNIVDVVSSRNYMLLDALKNSIFVTVVSVTVVVVLGSMIAFVLSRRNDRWAKVVNGLVLAGLIVPPAVVPTIYVLQELNLFKTLWGLMLVEITYQLPFAILIFRGFMSSIPVQLDEAAMIDGCSGMSLFWRVIFPLLRPAVITVIVTSSVFIYNDFTGPLYFAPGSDNATVQLTLYNFQSQFSTQWNLMFMDVALITVPPLILFIFFNRKIVAGMSGAVKG